MRAAAVALLGSLLAATLGAGSASAAPGNACQKDLAELVTCWIKDNEPVTVDVRSQPGRQVVPLTRRTAPRNLPNLRKILTVTVPDGVTTTRAQTMLIVLAGTRNVGANSSVTALTPDDIEPLRRAGLCDPGLCETLSRDTDGRTLIEQRLAREIPPPPVIEDKTKSEDEGGLPGWLWPVLLAVLLALATLIVLWLRRPALVAGGRRPPAPPAPSPPGRTRAPVPRTPVHAVAGRPTGSPRPATVRTVLHPQGYVEIDRDLYRAAWAHPGGPPPEPGRPVEVYQGSGPDAGLLLAYPPGNGP